MSRFLKGFIVFSVLLNLLLAGIILGHAGRHFVGWRNHPDFQAIALALPMDKRQHFEETMQRAGQDTAAMRRQLSDGRKNVVNLLKAKSFDKTAYLAQVRKIMQLRAQIIQRMAEAVAQSAEPLSVEERTMLADMLFHPHPSNNMN